MTVYNRLDVVVVVRPDITALVTGCKTPIYLLLLLLVVVVVMVVVLVLLLLFFVCSLA